MSAGETTGTMMRRGADAASRRKAYRDVGWSFRLPVRALFQHSHAVVSPIFKHGHKHGGGQRHGRQEPLTYAMPARTGHGGT
jgi:hypothetical protein